MTGISTVTLLYTANIRGKLDLLPRLFTLIQREQQQATGPVFLLDLGDTCTPDAWICRATEGRAPFLALDGMGYDAALIGAREQVPIPPASLQRLSDSMIMSVIIWQREKTLTKREITLTVAPGMPPPDQPGVIQIDRSTDAQPAVGTTQPVLGDVAQGHLARVDLNWPDWTVTANRVIAITDATPADPTITAVVELVETEAHHYTHTQGDT